MGQKAKGSVFKPFVFDGRKTKAAFLIALGQDTKATIARQLKIHRNTLGFWESHRDFQEKVASIREKIIISTEEQLIKNLSEQTMNIRHILNEKFSQEGIVKEIDGVKLLSEFRKLMETIHTISKSKDPIRTEHNVNMNYGGKVQIEELLQGLPEDSAQRGDIEKSLLAIAGDIVDERAKEMDDDGGFPL